MEEIIKDDTFAKIRIARCQSSNEMLFGSELPHNHYINIEISKAVLQRGTYNDRISEDYESKNYRSIISVKMSSLQFAEMITSLNTEGVPCTIDVLNGVRLPKAPLVQNRKDYVKEEFDVKIGRIRVKADEYRRVIAETIEKAKLSKENAKNIIGRVDELIREVTSNLPYMADTFKEIVDKTVLEGKIQIEDAVNHKILSLGFSKVEDLIVENKLLKENNS